jgi:glutamate formiminotransferase
VDAVLECVVNISEGRRPDVVAAIAGAGGEALIDVHSDVGHHRSVLTLAGPRVEDAARGVAIETVRLLDIGAHHGAHPRIGVLDVVPFVPLPGTASVMADAVAARDRFARWAADELGLPCFLYGPERSLPEIRGRAFASLTPDTGPAAPHPTAGAAAVGARSVLVAYNLWLAGSDLTTAREAAAAIRSSEVRALGMDVGGAVQVSCNLVEPGRVGPEAVHDMVAALAPVARAELVGLIPAGLLAGIPPARWAELDLDPSRTIEARLDRAGIGRRGPS